THQTALPGVFAGGDDAGGAENIIWAVAHGHQAAISIHNHYRAIPVTERSPVDMNLRGTEMGLHEWSYSNDYEPARRAAMKHVALRQRLTGVRVEVELGFDLDQTLREVERCLNCDIQTHFTASACIECDACIDVCPMSCLTIVHDAPDAELRVELSAPAVNLDQPLFVS